MLINFENNINKKPLYFAGFLLFVCYLAVMSFVYQQLKSSAVEVQLNNLKQHQLFQDALRGYVNEELKPVFYQLQEQKILSPDFFDPHGLSGTFIARHVYQHYYSKLTNAGLTGWEYKISATTPRNPVNQANAEELKLLEAFNNDRSLKEFFRIETSEQKPFLYYAKPMQMNNAECLRCHGDPSTAPKQLIERYGSINAFHEKEGEIRAFVSYRFDLTKNLASVNKTFLVISLMVLALLLSFFVLGSRIYINQQKRNQIIQQQQQKLDYIAHHDFLTDLSNRHGLNHDLTELLTELNHTATLNLNLWVMMIDIDFFKAINDDFGHDVGDETLRTIGQILKAKIQTQKNATAYRLGGEEFLIIIPNADKATIQSVYQTICEALATAEIDGLDRVIKLSAGATQVNHEEHQYDILKRADEALYQAKNQGRNRLIIL